MRYSDVKDYPKHQSFKEPLGFHYYLLSALYAICGELDAISYCLRKRRGGKAKARGEHHENNHRR
jgi:hypothetical protein